jgi:HD-GYP domain-containing protein (c-di-GMP phosphodiesterase class II)
MRVLAVADVYEALISDRPYRAAYSPEAALELMSADVPAGLDPDAFAALKALLAQPDAWPTHGPLTGVRPSLRRVR